jgi:hypothetical protein
VAGDGREGGGWRWRTVEAVIGEGRWEAAVRVLTSHFSVREKYFREKFREKVKRNYDSNVIIFSFGYLVQKK